MARCGWCGRDELSNNGTGLEVHKPGFKKNLPNTRNCDGYSTYLEHMSEKPAPKVN